MKKGMREEIILFQLKSLGFGGHQGEGTGRLFQSRNQLPKLCRFLGSWAQEVGTAKAKAGAEVWIPNILRVWGLSAFPTPELGLNTGKRSQTCGNLHFSLWRRGDESRECCQQRPISHRDFAPNPSYKKQLPVGQQLLWE